MNELFKSVLTNVKDKEFDIQEDSVWVPSEHFNAAMLGITSPHYAKKFGRFGKARKKALIIAAVIALVAILASFDCIRTPVVKFFTSVYDTFATIFGAEDTNNNSISKTQLPDELPGEYQLYEREEDFRSITARYKNKYDKTIVIRQMSSSQYVTIDTQARAIDEGVINGCKYVLSKGDNSTICVVFTDEYVYIITTQEMFSDERIESIIKIFSK